MEIRPIDDHEVPAFRAAMMTVFGGDPAADVRGDERFRALIPAGPTGLPGRAWAATDRGLIVGTAATFDFGLTVPGGTLPMAGLTMVTVRPTHRRRGILRGLIQAHLDEARGRGLPVSGLWASEATIYGRFGYGVAAEGDDLELHAPAVQLAAQEIDEVEPVEQAAPELLPPIYDVVRAARPGMFTRSPSWWQYRRFLDRPESQKGASARRHALARRDGVATGYITYRHRGKFENNLPAGTLEIDEIIATDARAEATLWRFALAVDLFPRVTYWNAPVDSLLPWIASDPRRLRRQRSDSLWLRIADVPATLAARSYSSAGRLRIELVDPPASHGLVWELEVAGGAARCAPGTGPADLRLDRASLGSLYLGAVRASLLARAGRVQGAPAAVALADRLFDALPAPWCAEIF